MTTAAPSGGPADAQSAEAAYIRMFLSRRKRYMDYPSQVHIETVARCNARCEFCVYPDIERKGRKMSDELFRKILSDLSKIPAEHRYSVVPYKINDPFLDPGIIDKLRWINEELPHARIILTTNAIALTRKHIEGLNTVRNFEFLWLSLNGYDRASYRRRMGVDAFDRVVQNIHKVRKWFRYPEVVRIGRVNTNTDEDQRFYRFVRETFGEQRWVAGNMQGDFLGDVDQCYPTIPEMPCCHWFELSITCTGKVSLCCMDGHCHYPIGDVRKQGALDVYNGKQYRLLREKGFRRKAVQPCAACTFY